MEPLATPQFAETVLRVHALDRPRTLAAVTTLVVGRGHHLIWLRTTPRPDGDITVWLGLPAHALVDRLALQVGRLTEVVDVDVVPVAGGRGSARVRRVDGTSSTVGGRERHEAVVALEHEGTRRLGAGEADDRAGAVARAAAAALGLDPHAAAPRSLLVMERPGCWLAVAEAPMATAPEGGRPPSRSLGASSSGDARGGGVPVGVVDDREGWAVARATLATLAGAGAHRRTASPIDRTA